MILEGNSPGHRLYCETEKKIKYKLLFLMSYSQGKNSTLHTLLNTHGKTTGCNKVEKKDDLTPELIWRLQKITGTLKCIDC